MNRDDDQMDRGPRVLEGLGVCQWRECQEPAERLVPYGPEMAPNLQSAPEPVLPTGAAEPAGGAAMQVRLCVSHADAAVATTPVSDHIHPPADMALETPLD